MTTTTTTATPTPVTVNIYETVYRLDLDETAAQLAKKPATSSLTVHKTVLRRRYRRTVKTS